MNMSPGDQARIKSRAITYRTSSVWTEGRSGTVSAEGKPVLRVSAPPEFQGERGVWSPEELFVASVELCHMNTFLMFAARQNLPILSYRSHANGVLEQVDGDYRFTRIVIFPTIVVHSTSSEPEVHALLRQAEARCLVANSIESIVEISPTIIVQ